MTVDPAYNQKVIDVNVGGTQNIVDQCLAHDNCKKLVYVSSTSAIPELPKGQIIREVTQYVPYDPQKVLGCYSQSKAMNTQIVLDAAREKNLNACVVFPSGILGPEDYAVGEIGSALEPYLNQISLEMLNYCKGRKTVVFLPLVKTSQNFCELLNVHGFRAAEVNGASKDREKILKNFEDGEYDVLCNSMLLTEGWDCPSVDCIIVLRPTKVRSLYQQMVGRGMRLSPNKKELLLLDFLWMTERHDLCRPSALISKDEQIAARIDKKMMDNESGIDLIAAEDEAESDVIREREESLARELEAMKKRQRKLVDPIQYALSIAAEDLANYTPTFAWEMSPPTERQLDYLEMHGIYPESVTNCGLATLIIDKLKTRQFEGLATPKQIRCLERYGFYHVGTWSFEAASKMITRIANNRWFLPRGIDPSKYVPEGAKA